MAKDSVTYSQFACVGSGFSGIALGANLQRWYGITDLRLFERHADLGGTWLANKYPGCAVDIPSALYSFSFATNPDWTSSLPPQDELWRYARKVAEKYNLPDKITFNATVHRCEWKEGAQRWRVYARLADGTELIHECQFLFGATGILVHARKPEIPGHDTFKGDIFHTAHWRTDVDVTGKRVVVVGNGCTATQVVAAIADKTKSVTQFGRSRHWIVAPLELPSGAVFNALLKHVPGVMAFARLYVFLLAEYALRGFWMTRDGEAFRNRRQIEAQKYIKKKAPAKYHEMLLPDFAIGCKRRIFDCGYLDALHRDNVTLTEEAILEIVPEGVRTKDGIVEADIIVLSTGFSTNSYMAGIDMVGRGGETAEQHWESFGGAEAYVNLMMNKFPNFFMILGPNTTTGHTSTILAIENGINYALRVIRPIIEGHATSIDVKRSAEQKYSDQTQETLASTVFMSGGCRSWYVQEQSGKKRWNSMTYPRSQVYYWYECLFPRYSDFTYWPNANARRKSLLRHIVKLLLRTTLFTSLLGVALAAKTHGRDFQSYGPFLAQLLQVARHKLSI